MLLYCVRNIIYYNNINSVKFYLFVHKTDTHNAVSVAAAHQVVRHCFVTMRVYVHLYTRIYILIVVRNIGRFENWEGKKSIVTHIVKRRPYKGGCGVGSPRNLVGVVTGQFKKKNKRMSINLRASRTTIILYNIYYYTRTGQ